MKKIPTWVWVAGGVAALWYISRPKAGVGASVATGTAGVAPNAATVSGGTVAAGSTATGTTSAGRMGGGPHMAGPHGGHAHHHGGHRGGVFWPGFAGVDYGPAYYVDGCGCDDLPALQQQCTRRPGRGV